jgi:hypothetical protein
MKELNSRTILIQVHIHVNVRWRILLKYEVCLTIRLHWKELSNVVEGNNRCLFWGTYEKSKYTLQGMFKGSLLILIYQVHIVRLNSGNACYHSVQNPFVFSSAVCCRMGTRGKFLWTRQWTFGFHKMLGNSWVSAQLAASQEGLSSMSEWVFWSVTA